MLDVFLKECMRLARPAGVDEGTLTEFQQAIRTGSEAAVGVMLKSKEISAPEAERWRVRLDIVNAVNTMINTWEGVCHSCGGVVNGLNAVTASRTQCRPCAENALPDPATEELIDLIFANFPDAKINIHLLPNLSIGERRQLSWWLGKVSAGRDIPALPPVVQKLGTRATFGQTVDGVDVFPGVEIGEGGKLPPTHHTQDTSHLAYDHALAELDAAEADLNRALETSEFPEVVQRMRTVVQAKQLAATQAKDAMKGAV